MRHAADLLAQWDRVTIHGDDSHAEVVDAGDLHVLVVRHDRPVDRNLPVQKIAVLVLVGVPRQLKAVVLTPHVERPGEVLDEQLGGGSPVVVPYFRVRPDLIEEGGQVLQKVIASSRPEFVGHRRRPGEVEPGDLRFVREDAGDVCVGAELVLEPFRIRFVRNLEEALSNLRVHGVDIFLAGVDVEFEGQGVRIVGRDERPFGDIHQIAQCPPLAHRDIVL